jgi:hypothetical protein
MPSNLTNIEGTSGHPVGLVTALVTGAGGYVSVTSEIPTSTRTQDRAKDTKNGLNGNLLTQN